eukprot:scaffold15566_cov38-Phaeocystis_antarctica.AAC.3
MRTAPKVAGAHERPARQPEAEGVSASSSSCGHSTEMLAEDWLFWMIVWPATSSSIHTDVAAMPEGSTPVISAALEAVRSSTRGSGWALTGPASSWECQGAERGIAKAGV